MICLAFLKIFIHYSFVIGRTVGWVAHNIESKLYSGRIVRPATKFVGELKNIKISKIDRKSATKIAFFLLFFNKKHYTFEPINVTIFIRKLSSQGEIYGCFYLLTICGSLIIIIGIHVSFFAVFIIGKHNK